MNAINRASTKLFDILLTPFEALGVEWTLILVSGIFGVLALFIFKHISSQKGIAAAKDKIKGHMIEIRLYQDDLGLVSRAIGKVLMRNVQYVFLNFGPFIPLSIPFVLVLSQMVVRYGFEPVPVTETSRTLLAGEGTTLRIEFQDDAKAAAADLKIVYPEGLQPTSPLVRVAGQGFATQEFVATRGGQFEIQLAAGGATETKRFDVGEEGDQSRYRQGERLTGIWTILWPAEDSFSADSPFEVVSFAYPESDLGWLPGSGPGGVLVVFFVASMLFGVLALKPLGVTI